MTNSLFRPPVEGLFKPSTGDRNGGIFTPGQDDEDPPGFAPSGQLEEIIVPADLPPKKRLVPLCLFLIGRLNAGKTLSMVALGKIQWKRYRKHGIRKRVMANFDVSFAHSDPYLLDRLLADPLAFQNCLILIDEITSAFPSKRAMATINVQFETVLRQIRKMRTEMIFTTQYPQTVDRTVLTQTDLFVRCHQFGGGRGVDLDFYDWWGLYTGDDRLKPWPPVPDEHDWDKTLHNTQSVWDDFDTYEFIATMYGANRDMVVGRQYEIEDPEEGAALTPEQVPPSSIDELIDQQGPSVNVNYLKDVANLRFDAEITRQELVERLEQRGFEIEKRRGAALKAIRKQPPEDTGAKKGPGT